MCGCMTENPLDALCVQECVFFDALLHNRGVYNVTRYSD